MLESSKDILEKIKNADRPEEFPTILSALDSELPQDILARAEILLQAGETLNAKGQYLEGLRVLESAFDHAKNVSAIGLQALALGLMADIFRAQGNFRAALIKLTEARKILGEKPQQDQSTSARIYILSGLNNMSLGDYEIARQHFYEAYQLYHQMGDIKGRAIAANRLGTVATMLAHYNEAEDYLQQSLKLAKSLGDRHAMAGALLNLGEIQRLQGRPDAARPLYYEASALFTGMGMHRGICIAENNLGHISVQMNEYPTAKYHYSRALECAKTAGLIPDMLDTLAGLVFILIAREEYGQAAQCIAFILSHPAHLQETEQYLEPAQVITNQHTQVKGPLPPPDRLEPIVEETLAYIFLQDE